MTASARNDGAGELGQDVRAGEHRHDSPCHEQPERDRRVEVPAGDVPERRDHHRDREAVRERDGHDAALLHLGDRDRADAHEDEGEGADELGGRPAQGVELHGAERTERIGRALDPAWTRAATLAA